MGRLEGERTVLREGDLEVWWTRISSAVASQQKPPALEQIPQQGWHVSLERKDDLEMKESAASPERGQVK